MSSQKTFVLKSSDNQTFDISEPAAKLSQVINQMIEDCPDNMIPLSNVDGGTLSKVVEYCEKHAKEDGKEKEDDEKEENKDKGKGKEKSKEKSVKEFDEEFVSVGKTELFDLILAANYLNIKNLLELTCTKAADMIKDKSPEEVRTMFNIQNDYTPEEEAEVRKENAWAFEP